MSWSLEPVTYFTGKGTRLNQGLEVGSIYPWGIWGISVITKVPLRGMWVGQSKREAEGGGRHFRMEEERDQEPRDVGSF